MHIVSEDTEEHHTRLTNQRTEKLWWNQLSIFLGIIGGDGPW